MHSGLRLTPVDRGAKEWPGHAPNDELKQQIEDLSKEAFNLRFRHATGELENTARLGAAKRDIAKLLTVAKEKERLQSEVEIAREVQEHFPHLVIFARARNRAHAYQLMELGIQHVTRHPVGRNAVAHHPAGLIAR